MHLDLYSPKSFFIKKNKGRENLTATIMLISELLRCQVLFASIKLESKDSSAAPLASPKKCSDLVILRTTMWGPDLRALLNSSGSVIADYARQPEQHFKFSETLLVSSEIIHSKNQTYFFYFTGVMHQALISEYVRDIYLIF